MTTAQIISIAKVSQFLSAREAYEQQYLKGTNNSGDLSRLLYLIRRNVEYMFGVQPDEATLTGTANYLYALCGRYLAQVRLSAGNSVGSLPGGGGGSGGNFSFETEYFTVGGSTSFAPTDGIAAYANTDRKGQHIAMIYLASIGRFLKPSEWAPRAGGGFDLIGRTFNDGDEYAVVFTTASSTSASSPATDGWIITDPATGQKAKIGLTVTDGSPDLTYTLL